MAVEHSWPVTGYSIALTSRAFGWIELKDGEHVAGYIYFQDEPDETMPRFGANHMAHIRTSLCPCRQPDVARYLTSFGTNKRFTSAGSSRMAARCRRSLAPVPTNRLARVSREIAEHTGCMDRYGQSCLSPLK